MIALRLGTARQADSPVGPGRDVVRLEIEGVNILPGADDEDLRAVVSAWGDALQRLRFGAPSAQVSLERSHLEVCFQRLDDRVRLQVFRGRGLSWTRVCALEVDGAELYASSPRAAPASPRAESRDRRATAIVPSFMLTVVSGRYELVLLDGAGALQRYSKGGGDLLPLLVPGTFGEYATEYPLLGLLNALVPDAEPSLKTLAHRVCTVLFALFPPLLEHPALREAFEVTLPPPRADAMSSISIGPPTETPRASAAPLTRLGTPARVRFSCTRRDALPLEQPWKSMTLLGKTTFVSAPRALAITTSRRPDVLVHLGPKGTAVAEDGTCVFARENRLALFDGAARDAQWVRNDFSSDLLPSAFSVGSTLVLHSAQGLQARGRLVGNHVWGWTARRRIRQLLRIDPLVIAACENQLTAVRALDGRIQWELSSGSSRVLAAPQGILSISSGSDSSLIELIDTANGALLKSISFDGYCIEVAAWKKQWFALFRTGHGTALTAFNEKGQPAFVTAVPVKADTARLAVGRHGILVHDASGSAARVTHKGQLQWVLGGLGDSLDRTLPAIEVRKLSIIPGTTVRVLDSERGTVLGQLDARTHLIDLKVDNRLTLTTLSPGALETWKPHGALVAL